MAATGTPLIEPIENDDAHSLVTFVWRVPDNPTTVFLANALDRFDPQLSGMTQLLETNLWYKTHRVRNDLRTLYAFTTDAGYAVASWQPDPLNKNQFAYDPDNNANVRSILTLPDAPPQLWIDRRSDIPVGS